MKEYMGVDLGKRKAVVVKKDRHGKVTGKAVLAVTEAALSKYFSGQDPRSEVVVEAMGNWMYLYETIEQYTPHVVLRTRSAVRRPNHRVLGNFRSVVEALPPAACRKRCHFA